MVAAANASGVIVNATARNGLLGLGFATTFVLSASGTVHGVWARRSVAECLTDYEDGMFSSGGFGPRFSSTKGAYIHCPVVDTDSFPKASLRTLRVFGYDGSEEGNVSAQACVIHRDGREGSHTCSSWADSGSVANTGAINFNLGTTARSLFANREGDFGFIVVRLPPVPANTFGFSEFYGYYQSNP